MRQRGFTMIESVVALSVLATLGAAAGYGLVGGVRAYSESADVLQTLDELRYANERIVREVREIRRDPTDPARFDIAEMTATTLRFTRGDGAVVTISATPPRLTLAYAAVAGAQTLSDELGRLHLAYLRGDGTTTATDGTDVAFVALDVELSRAGRIFPQRTRVALRNRR